MLVAISLLLLANAPATYDDDRIVVTKARSASGEEVNSVHQAVRSDDGTFFVAPKTNPRPASPLTNPGNWVTTSDYPSQALREDFQGTVRFLLNIDLQGRVTKCTVTQSSGAELLDQTACDLITARARFSPATDKRGRAVPGTYANAVRWTIPTDRPQSKPSPSYFEFTQIVEADGSLGPCELVRTEGISAEVQERFRATCGKDGRSFDAPYTDGNGNPVRRRLRSIMQVMVEPVP